MLWPLLQSGEVVQPDCQSSDAPDIASNSCTCRRPLNRKKHQKQHSDVADSHPSTSDTSAVSRTQHRPLAIPDREPGKQAELRRTAFSAVSELSVCSEPARHEICFNTANPKRHRSPEECPSLAGRGRTTRPLPGSSAGSFVQPVCFGRTVIGI